MRSARKALLGVVGMTLLLFSASLLHAATPVVDQTNATVVPPPGLSKAEQKAVQMLIEEVEKRSRLSWKQISP